MGVGGGGGRICQKVDLFRHHDAITHMHAPKVSTTRGSRGGGVFPWGKFATVGLRRALFLHSIGPHFEETIMLSELEA